MADYVDLHIHTTFSDGLTSPADALDIIREKKLAGFAITDHDSYGAYFEIKKMLKPGDPEMIPGIELSAGKSGQDIHILGYQFDTDSTPFKNAVEEFRKNRNQRGAKMLKELMKLGVDIPMELVRQIAGDSAIGRPHVAEALVQVGAVSRYNEAFSKYLGIDCPAYVPKENLNPQETINLIHDANGLAILAHPGVSDVAQYINEFIGYGLDGLEVYHPGHNARTRKTLKKIAIRESLLISGGSDHHGREGHHEMIGSQNIRREYLDNIIEKSGL